MPDRKTRHKSTSETKTSSVSTLARGLEILDWVVSAGAPVRLRDVTEQFDIDRAMAFRFLQTLCQFGALRKDPKSKRYIPGGRFHTWLLQAGNRVRSIDIIRPFLKDVVQRTQQSAHVGMLIHDQALLADFVPSDSVVSVKNRIGVLEPLYCTAIGKALLASLPNDEQNEIVSHITFNKYTPRTITNADVLRRHLAEVRQKGIAFDDGEYNDLLICVATPVDAPPELPALSIGVSMLRPVVAKDRKILAKVAGELRDVAQGMKDAIRRM